jgi:hypothetical protein
LRPATPERASQRSRQQWCPWRQGVCGDPRNLNDSWLIVGDLINKKQM